MIKRFCITIMILYCVTGVKAQFTENFSDGDLTGNPVWTGNLTDWNINPMQQLQSNNLVTSSTYYLSTSNALATSAQWDFFCQLGFNTSSTNYVDVYLTASASDLTQSNTTGYFVRIGSTDDDICLYRKDAGLAVKIIDGANGILNNSNNQVKIKIIRNATNQWSLFRDMTGAGNNFFIEGIAADATYTGSSFFGILVKQSTASFFQRHFFDNIEVKAYVPDTAPPVIVSATATSATTLDVLFNEPVDPASSQVTGNYSVDNGIGIPVSAVRDAANNSLVHLFFSGSFPLRTNLALNVDGVKDISANVLSNAAMIFSYFIPVQFDIVIDEIMADPSPQVALPNNEWIELRNTSPFTIDLQGWRLADLSGQSGPIPVYQLKPDSVLLICSATAASALAIYGPVVSVTGFPSLDNTGDLIYLISPQGKIIHTVNYTDEWYRNELKKEGGWSLEMIDTKNACSGYSNWKASADIKGGTPASKNAVDGINKDDAAPRIVNAFANNNTTITIVFNEPLDSIKAAAANSYSISDGIGLVMSANVIGPLFDKVVLQLSTALLPNKVYTITVSNITDCAGNTITPSGTVKVGLSNPALHNDVVINEVLFNPRFNGTDFVEIYNNSEKTIDLQQLYIANRNSAGAVSSIVPISIANRLLFPGDFMVVTESAAIIKSQYITKDTTSFAQVSAIPSFNDDKGDVIILNMQGEIIDELAYNEKWHFKLIDNREAVSLERIDYNDSTQKEGNWHSAATSVGYATPTYKNSQYNSSNDLNGAIKITPEIISPDNDGIDDFATIEYEFPSPGYVADITIFDAAGRTVRHLQQSALCGIKGNYRWDGLGDKYQQLPIGIYVIYTVVFTLEGKKERFKNTIVVARRN